MFSTDPGERAEFIDGLRQLADYLTAHPGVPVPRHGATIVVTARDAEDGGITDIVAMSIELGTSFAEQDGTYRTARTFGPVTYKGYATSTASLARHDAWFSYYGRVTPDD